MTSDHLAQARAAFDDGRAMRAIDLAWKAVRPAVMAQDSERIGDTQRFAEQVAAATDGTPHDKAEQLAAYCGACLLEPRDYPGLPWAFSRFFRRSTRSTKRCPDCAESILADARVCRFCGYRYPDPSD